MPYIGKSTDGLGIRERFTYVASANATSISGADANSRTLAFEDPEYVDVFLNGVRLKKDTDYNTNTANTIAGLSALAANDEVEVIVNDIFTLADMVNANTGGDFRGNLAIAKDSAVLSLGLDKEITLTHDADKGLKIKNTSTTGNSGVGAILTLQTGDTDVAVNNVLGDIQFQAPDEGTGTDAILVGAAIKAISEGNFSSSNNATKLSFHTAASEAAAEKMSLSSAGILTVSGSVVSSGAITGGGLLTTGGNIVIPDAGTIGSASDTNALAISSAGVLTISTNTDSSNSTTGAIVAHSAGFADDVNIGDTLNVTGAITGSSTIQGTAITATTAFLPDASGGATLGTASLEFGDIFLGDGSVIKFGDDQDVLLTHVADTGLTLNGTFVATAITGTTITASTAFVPDASDGATLGSATLEFSDLFLADAGEVKFGADQDVSLVHDHNAGLIISRSNTSDNSPVNLTFQTGETDIAADDVLGKISFQAPDEATGTDAVLISAAIAAISEGDFSASNNATKLSFMTGASEVAAEKMSLSSAGVLTVSGAITSSGVVTGTGFTIGSAVIAEAELELLDGVTAGTAIASKVVTTDANIDSTGMRNLTISGELDAATLDISGAIDVAGTSNLDVVDIDGAVNMATTALVTGVLTTTAATVFNGGFASNAASTITTADNLSGLILESTDADAQVGPTLQLKRNSGSPADSDNLGNIIFVGENDADEAVVYGNIGFTAPDVSNGTEDGLFFLNVINAGTERSRMFMNATETVFNEESLNLDFRIESDGVQHMFHLDGQHSSVCIGNNTTTHRFIVHSEVSGDHVAAIRNDGNNVNKLGLVILAGTDDNSGTNTMIQFRDGDNTDVGSITASGGTVTYSAFTAVHPAILPGADNANGYAYGTLVETTSIAYEKNSSGNDFERGIIYNVTKSASANSRSVLGAYSGKLNAWISSSNKHNINILGDGHILCNNSGGNIAVGDGICTSATAGIGQKATVSPSMIIGIAQEAVTFSNGTETKLVPVQYGLQQFTPW